MATNTSQLVNIAGINGYMQSQLSNLEKLSEPGTTVASKAVFWTGFLFDVLVLLAYIVCIVFGLIVLGKMATQGV